MLWVKFNGEKLDLPVKTEVENALIREINLGHKLKVCIGTDSMVYGSIIHFATVIVILREHRGGFMYISRDRIKKKMHIKERMLAEVSKSIDVAYLLCDTLNRYDIDLEVHADINTNPNFKSNKALHEAMGYILSMGFIFKAKPEAFASSYCANKKV